jgi:predicted O-methyltransferase YrrM
VTGWSTDTRWWHITAQESAEDEVSDLAGAFVRALQPEAVVETGTYTGQTAARIGEALAVNGHGHLWTVEIDPGFAATAEDACQGLPVTVVRGSSLDWQPPASIDFAWIDSGDAATRAQEIRSWLPLFSPGAVIGVHDTNPGHSPVGDAVAGLIAEGLVAGITLRTPRGVSFLQVVR